jgi:hypothetical protein
MIRHCIAEFRHVFERLDVGIAAGDKQIAATGRQWGCHDPAWIAQRPQNAEKVRLRRAMFTRSHERRIWAARLQGSDQESDNQGKIALTANIGKELPQSCDWRAAFRKR